MTECGQFLNTLRRIAELRVQLKSQYIYKEFCDLIAWEAKSFKWLSAKVAKVPDTVFDVVRPRRFERAMKKGHREVIESRYGIRVVLDHSGEERW